MIYFFWGDNQFALGERVNELISSHKEKYGSAGIERIDGEEIGDDFVTNLTAQSLFSPQRLLIVRNLTLNKKVVQLITEVLDSIPDTTDLVIWEQKIKKNTTIYKQLSKLEEVHEFKELNEQQTAHWLSKFVDELDGKIDARTASYLVNAVGTNQSMLANEARKLVGFQKVINQESIDLLVEKKPEDNVFELLDNISNGNSQKARELYRDIRRAQAEPYYVMSMIGWQLNNMATVAAHKGKTAQQIASEAGISPYVAQKTQRITRNLQISDISKMVDYASAIDLDMKTTPADSDQLVEQLIDRLGQVVTD